MIVSLEMVVVDFYCSYFYEVGIPSVLGYAQIVVALLLHSVSD